MLIILFPDAQKNRYMVDNIYDDLRVKVLLSTHKAMLGMIHPNIRLVTIDWGDTYFYIKAYFDRPTNSDDLDILKTISTEVAADFPDFSDSREFAEFSNEPVEKLEGLKKWCF